MNGFYPRATPPHKETALRIECEHEGGHTGRYHLAVYEGERWVAGRFYDWNVWLGHCYGQLLIDDFVDYAEVEARRQLAPVVSDGGGRTSSLR